MSSIARLKGFNKQTVWAQFGKLTAENDAISLGQGAPDWQPPSFIKSALKDAAEGSAHQYARAVGDIELCEVLANNYSKTLNKEINPLTNVMITNGATEAIFCALISLVSEGDEVILFEPAFDIYPAQVQMASGIPVFVSIDYNSNNGNWIFDIDALEKAITQKTKVILINSPMNPTGRMLTLDELQSIAIMLQRYPNIIVISDEVYDYLYFNPDKKHISLASLAGMFDRTITISSAAKTFSITGWKVGWAVSSKNLIDQMMASQQWIVYSICTPAQKALSKIIANANNQYKDDENGLLYETYYDYLRQSYHKKIIKLVEYCREVDLKPIIPDGAFYVLCDISNIHIPDKYLNETDDEGNRLSNDWAFCMFLTREIKVSAIPASAFYLRKEMKYKAQNLIRLCACKLDSTLEEAGNRLKRLKEFHI